MGMQLRGLPYIAAPFLPLIVAAYLFGAFTTRNFSEILGDTQLGTCVVGDTAYDTDNNVTLRCIGGNVYAAVAMPSAYGQLYEETPGGTNINIATGGTFVQWVSSTAGLSNLVTLSTANDDITIDAGAGGTYLIVFQVSFTGSTNEIFHWSAFVEGAEVIRAASERRLGPGLDQGSVSGLGIVALVPTDVVDLRVTSTTNTESVTVDHVQLVVARIGL